MLMSLVLFLASSAVAQQEMGVGFLPSGYEFFFRPDLRRPARNQTPQLITATSVIHEAPTTQPTSTSTNKEFTGIAFPPQVFEILTGNSPSVENLGGRKNVTMSLTSSEGQQEQQQPQQQASTNSSQVPSIINGAIRPPTRFPPGNKPTSYQPATQRPASSSNGGYNKPQEGSIAAATTESEPDNRVGEENMPNKTQSQSSFKPTRTPVLSANRPSLIIPSPPPPPPPARPPLTPVRQPSKPFSQHVKPPTPPPPPPRPILKPSNPKPIIATTYRPSTTPARPPNIGTPAPRPTSAVLRSISGIQQFLQGAIFASPVSEVARGNFLVSPLGVTLTMAQMLMAAGPRAKNQIRTILRLYPKSDPNEEIHHELLFHKELGEMVRALQRSHTEPEAAPAPWNRGANGISDPYTLALDTATFVQTGLAVRPAFVHSIESLYQSRLALLDFRNDPFGSLAAINEWAEKASRGKIPNLLSVPRSPSTAVLFCSSLYFNAAWRNPFAPVLTSPGAFHVSPTETLQVPYMKGSVCDGSKYINSPEFGVIGVRLAYNHTDEVAMYLFKPHKANTTVHSLAHQLLRQVASPRHNQRTNVKNFQDPLPASWEAHKQASVGSADSMVNNMPSVDHWVLDDVIAMMKPQCIIMSLPRCVVRGSLRLNQAAGSGGSTSREQLSGLLEDTAQLTASTEASESIIHETILELTETGTEAAAVTVDSVDYIREQPVFKLDRPFLLLLRHETTGMPLFWGAVVRPMVSREVRKP